MILEGIIYLFSEAFLETLSWAFENDSFRIEAIRPPTPQLCQ